MDATPTDERMTAVFFGDGEYGDFAEEVYPLPGQTYRESAQDRADSLAAHRASGLCGWCWDRANMRARADDQE